MWKLICGICLTLCVTTMADDTPPKSTVSVHSCGRLRHGVVAIGGETTGTTITFNRIIWELQLNDADAREFAKRHHKKTVMVTGSLRKISGIEAKDRWIIDVKMLSEHDATKDKEGAQLSIQGTLQAEDPRHGDSSSMTVVVGDHVWPIDLTSDSKLQFQADSLVGQPVLLTGSLEQVTKTESAAGPVIVRAKTLKRIAIAPVQGQSD
jgi:hypothetical protein